MAGLAQVKGVRGEIRTIRTRRNCASNSTPSPIENWSLPLDFWILLLTVQAVIWDRDAY